MSKLFKTHLVGGAEDLPDSASQPGVNPRRFRRGAGIVGVAVLVLSGVAGLLAGCQGEGGPPVNPGLTGATGAGGLGNQGSNNQGFRSSAPASASTSAAASTASK